MAGIFEGIAEEKLEEATQLNAIFQAATSWQPKRWGKIIGYGQYHYQYASGREGDFLATGFSMRARDISLHILPGYSEYSEIANRLGPHKRGKSCWYIKRLSDVDEAALGDLIRAGVEDLRGQWPVEAS